MKEERNKGDRSGLLERSKNKETGRHEDKKNVREEGIKKEKKKVI